MAKTKKVSDSKAKDGKAGKDGKAESPLKRKLGLRGAAPWAARHAAKHAAEARARAAEPPLPGSARATIRIPEGADDIKQKISDLHNALVQIKGLRKNVQKTFYEIGNILKDIQARRLYVAKGYGSFEAFLEREFDLGKTLAMRLVRVVTIFLKEAAVEHGMERLLLALQALEGGLEGAPHDDSKNSKKETLTGKIPPPPVSATALPLRPPGK
jgi:hypothetical protein